MPPNPGDHAEGTQPGTKPFRIIWQARPGGWKGRCADLEAYGKSKARVKAALERKLAWHFLKAGIIPPPVPPPNDPDLIFPAGVNPVSLALREVFQQHGGIRQVSQMTGITAGSLTRLANPFYWGQSTSIIRQIADGTDTHIVLEFGPDKDKEPWSITHD